MSGVKEFNFHVKVTVDEDHPLYNDPNNVITGEIAILIMNGMMEDPMLRYECEVIK
jgi:hypothetical protein